MKFYQIDSALRLLISPWFPMQAFFNFDKHSPWETLPVQLRFFCIGSKNRSSGGNGNVFLPKPINFSASEEPKVEFPDARNCPEKN